MPFVNRKGYIVGINAPNGKFISINPGCGVKGPGFEKHIEAGILVEVPDNQFTGRIVFESAPSKPRIVPVAKATEAPKAEKPKLTPKPLDRPTKSVVAEVKKNAPAPSKPNKTTPKAAPDSRTKPAAPTVKVPDETNLRSMTKRELVSLSDSIGLDSSGTKTKVISRLLPIAGKTANLK